MELKIQPTQETQAMSFVPLFNSSYGGTYEVFEIVKAAFSNSNGTHIQLEHGCNGKKHAVLTKKTWRENGQVISEEIIGGIILGPCDEACKGFSVRHGSFLFPFLNLNL